MPCCIAQHPALPPRCLQVLRSRLQQRMDARALQYTGVTDVVRKTLQVGEGLGQLAARRPGSPWQHQAVAGDSDAASVEAPGAGPTALHRSGASPLLRAPACLPAWRVSVQREGIGGFYKGLVPNVLRVMPQSALTFLVYESVMRFLSKQRQAAEAAAAAQQPERKQR